MNVIRTYGVLASLQYIVSESVLPLWPCRSLSNKNAPGGLPAADKGIVRFATIRMKGHDSATKLFFFSEMY